MGSAQAINAAWLTAKMQDHKRPVALAAYVMSIQLANFPGNELFTTQGKLLFVIIRHIFLNKAYAIARRSSI